MIAIVYPQFYGVGGIARYIDSFLTNLPEQHPTIYLITGDEYQIPRTYPNVEIIHIPFKASRFNLFFWTLQANKVLKKLYVAQKITVVNLHIPPLITGLLLIKSIPMVLTAHTTYLGMSGQFYAKRFFKSQWSKLEIAIKIRLEQAIFKHAKSIITLTNQGAQELSRYNVSVPVHIVPNGVDTSAFKHTEITRKTVDVLFCGRIEVRKGSRAMVDVCKKLVLQRPNIKILIVGYGDDDVWVKTQLQPYMQNITLTGKVPFAEMSSVYAGSRVYASTSYYEGLPGTCLEAMASGLPAIVWDFPFYEALIIHGKNGARVVPNDTNAMVVAITKQLDDLQQDSMIAQHVRQHVHHHYNWQTLAKQLIQILR